MFQYWFVNFNIPILYLYHTNMLTIGEIGYRICINSVLTSYFFYDSKTVLKLIKKANNYLN